MLRFVDSVISFDVIPNNMIKFQNMLKFDRWSFWGIYFNYGLNGSFKSLFGNFYVIMLSLMNITVTFVSAMAFSSLINVLNTGQKSIMMYFLLGSVILSRELMKGFRHLMREKIDKTKDIIIARIFDTIIGHLNNANAELRDKYTHKELFEALSRFIWVYDVVSDTLFDSLTLSIQTIVFTGYVIIHDPVLILAFFSMYYMTWYYIIPYTSTDDTHFQNPDVMWKRSHNDMIIARDNYINPLFSNLYQSHANTVSNRSIFRSEKLEKILMDRFVWNESNLQKKKIVGPNVSEDFVRIIQYYEVRNTSKRDRLGVILMSQNIFIFVLVSILFYTESYASALLILMNRSTLFGAFEVLNDIKNIENSSSRNLEKIVTILKDIDNQIFEDVQHIDNLRIHKITIDNITLTLDTEKDKKGKTRQFQISLRDVEIDVKPGKCLLIEGKSGCGKSVIMNVLTGMYAGTKYPGTLIMDENGITHNIEFNQIKQNRVYISQSITDDYKYNNSITFPLFELFPLAKNIDEIKDFLVAVFKLRVDRIPNSLSDIVPGRLSGGEIQRYVVASQIWKILISPPDILFLDEIDRALDKDTAIHLIEWILTSIPCYCVIVTHLSEVREMIKSKNFVNQRWSYVFVSDSVTNICID